MAHNKDRKFASGMGTGTEIVTTLTKVAEDRGGSENDLRPVLSRAEAALAVIVALFEFRIFSCKVSHFKPLRELIDRSGFEGFVDSNFDDPADWRVGEVPDHQIKYRPFTSEEFDDQKKGFVSCNQVRDHFKLKGFRNARDLREVVSILYQDQSLGSDPTRSVCIPIWDGSVYVVAGTRPDGSKRIYWNETTSMFPTEKNENFPDQKWHWTFVGIVDENPLPPPPRFALINWREPGPSYYKLFMSGAEEPVHPECPAKGSCQCTPLMPDATVLAHCMAHDVPACWKTCPLAEKCPAVKKLLGEEEELLFPIFP